MKVKQQKYAEFNRFFQEYHLKETEYGEVNVVVNNKEIFDFIGFVDDEYNNEL
jgi:hypothetical protein